MKPDRVSTSRLPANVQPPENTTEYLVVPGVPAPADVYVRTPRLVHPEQAADFVKTVAEEKPHAGLPGGYDRGRDS